LEGYFNREIFYMVRLFLFLVVFIGIFNVAFSQKKNISSHNTSDSLQVLNLNDEGFSLLDDNPDSALVIFNRTLEISHSIDFKQEIIRGLSGIADAYFNKNEIKKSTTYYRKVLHAAQEYDSPNQEAKTAIKLSNIIREKSPLEALQLSLSALALSEKVGNAKEISKARMSLGLSYEQKGSMALAVENFDKAVEIGRPIREYKLVAKSLVHLANIYQKTSDFGKALDSYYQAIDIGEREANQDLVVNAKTKIASIYRLQGKSQQAVQMLLDAIQYYKDENNLPLQMVTYHDLGLTVKEKGEPLKALAYLIKSQEIAKKIGNKKMMAKNNIEKGRNYLTLNNTKLALQNASWGLSSAQKANYLEEIMNAYKIYADTYSKVGNTGLALRYYKKYDVAKNKFFEEKIAKQAEVLSNKFKTREDELITKVRATEEEKNIKVHETKIEGQKQVAKKKEVIKELDAKNDKLKNNTLIGLSLLLLLFSIGTIIAYKNKISDYQTIKKY